MVFYDGSHVTTYNGQETMAYTHLLGARNMMVAGCRLGKDEEKGLREDFCSPPCGGVKPLFEQIDEYVNGGNHVVELLPEVSSTHRKMLLRVNTKLTLDNPAQLAAGGEGEDQSMLVACVDVDRLTNLLFQLQVDQPCQTISGRCL